MYLLSAFSYTFKIQKDFRTFKNLFIEAKDF